MMLHCDERSNDLPSSDESKQHSPQQGLAVPTSFQNQSVDLFSSANVKLKLDGERENRLVPRSVGDLVWVQIPGYPQWPGKIITSVEANKPELEVGKVRKNRLERWGFLSTNQFKICIYYKF